MRPIKHCLNSRLSDICRQVMELETLNILIQQFLPNHLAPHCNVGSFLKGTLTLVIDNAVWYSELYYQLGELRDQLRKEGGLYQLSSIKISVNSHN